MFFNLWQNSEMDVCSNCINLLYIKWKKLFVISFLKRGVMLRRECNLLTAVNGFKVDLEASRT